MIPYIRGITDWYREFDTVRGWAPENERHAAGATVELAPHSSWLLRAADPAG